LTGSEGTLAVISKIIVKLIPLPEHRVTFLIDFKSLRKGAEFINRVITGRIYPSVLEFMDRTSIRAVYSYLKLSLNDKIHASVLIEIDGNKADITARKEKFIEIVKTSDVLDYKTAETEDEQDKLWHLRRNISPAISKLQPKKINEDIVVPTSKIPDAVEYINKVAAEQNIDIVLFGHFGDGNIHANLMVDPEDREEMRRAEVALDKIFNYVITVKGSITGEHGVGISKKPFMKYQFSPVEMELFKNVKQAFDPHNLLNPGKIF
jgi:FAD/FMN-containing dehydrogenase